MPFIGVIKLGIIKKVNIYLRCFARFLVCAVFCVLIVMQKISPLPKAAGEAELLRDGVTVTMSGGLGSWTVRDGSRDSYMDIASGNEISVTSTTDVYAVYFIWDSTPGEWTLETESEYSHYATGFLHELVILDEPSGDIRVILSDTNFRLCEMYLFGEGEIPAWVQRWEPVLDRADLLALPTHADDEHLFFGGILPTYAGELGFDVQVAYMTSHWDNRVRPHELLDGLWTAGVTAYPLIGPFPDLFASKDSLANAETVYSRAEVLEYQVELLRRFKPRVVVGHDLNGEYGHGAHILNAQTLVEAIELSGDETYYPNSLAKYGVWDVPKTYLHLYAENQLVMDWNKPLDRFGGATAYETAVESFAKHVSQSPYFAVTQGGTWEDCRKFGLVRSTVGPDVLKNDLFENIDMSPPETPEPSPTAEPTPEPTPEPTAATVTPVPTEQPPEPDSDSAVMLWVLRALVALLVILVLLALMSLARPKKGRRRR